MGDKENTTALQGSYSPFLSSGCFLDYLLSGQLNPRMTIPALLSVCDAFVPAAVQRCTTSPHLFIALDYDGTLTPIVARPEEARPSAMVLDLLSRLVQAPEVSVAIVSGRSLTDLFTLLPVQGLMYVGTHGLEVCTAEGRVSSLLPPGAFSTIFSRLRRDAERLIAEVPGAFLEDKGQALTLHYRLASPESAANVITRFLADIHRYRTKGVAVEVLHGKKALEVLPVGINKGKALQLFRRSQPSDTLFLYLGDDATDELAFRALPRHGIAILVADPPRPTFAQYYVRNPDEVVRLLARLLELRAALRQVA